MQAMVATVAHLIFWGAMFFLGFYYGTSPAVWYAGQANYQQALVADGKLSR